MARRTTPSGTTSTTATPPPGGASLVSTALTFASGLLFGALVAAAVAILVAPSDGRTFRRRIRDALNEFLGPEPADMWAMPVESQAAVPNEPLVPGGVAGARR